jgi:hypothetical protein
MNLIAMSPGRWLAAAKNLRPVALTSSKTSIFGFSEESVARQDELRF